MGGLGEKTVTDEAPKHYQSIQWKKWSFLPPADIDLTFTVGAPQYHGNRAGLRQS